MEEGWTSRQLPKTLTNSLIDLAIKGVSQDINTSANLLSLVQARAIEVSWRQVSYLKFMAKCDLLSRVSLASINIVCGKTSARWPIPEHEQKIRVWGWHELNPSMKRQPSFASRTRNIV